MKAQRHSVLIGAVEHAYILRRSRRARNLLLHVGLDGTIEVVVPWHTAYREAEYFVRSETAWVERALAKNRRLRAAMPQRLLNSGALLPLLGDLVQLEVVTQPGRRRARSEEDGSIIRVWVQEASNVRRTLERWYKKKAHSYFLERAQCLAAEFNVVVSRVAVSGAATQWGSCIQEHGRLSLHWRLLLGPRPIADYVVAHEVAHLRERGHSARFWQHVARLDSGFQEHRRWLRRYGHTLVL
jgi:predicted metal-dependent hydrolase